MSIIEGELLKAYFLPGSNYFIAKKMFDKKQRMIFCEFDNGEIFQIFEGYYIITEDIENKRFFKIKNSHEKKKKIVVFTLEKKLEIVDDFIELDEDFYVYGDSLKKTWVIYKNKINGPFNTTPKSFSKIYLEYIFDNVKFPEIKAYKCELIETRKAHHIFNENKNTINFTKSLYIIPFFESYIPLTIPEEEDKAEKENKKEYYSGNIKKVFVENFDKEKKEIIFQIINEYIFYSNKKKNIKYEIMTLKASFNKGEISYKYFPDIRIIKLKDDEWEKEKINTLLIWACISKEKIYLKSLKYILKKSKFKKFRISIED